MSGSSAKINVYVIIHSKGRRQTCLSYNILDANGIDFLFLDKLYQEKLLCYIISNKISRGEVLLYAYISIKFG